MFRIQKSADGNFVVFTLSGRIEATGLLKLSFLSSFGPNFWSRSKSSRPRPRQGHDTAMASAQQPKLSSKWRNDMKDTKTLKETSKF